MARYLGPKTKKARALGEAIYGPDRAFERRKSPPGQHGAKRRRQKSDYAQQLMEKQKAKYTYGVLERQFSNLFKKANAKSGVTGVVLLQLLESRLDNIVFRLGLAPTRNAARQLVSHKHVLVNGILTNIPSHSLRPGDEVSIRNKSVGLEVVQNALSANTGVSKWNWLEWNPETKNGKFLSLPERSDIPERINEQLIVELYSK